MLCVSWMGAGAVGSSLSGIWGGVKMSVDQVLAYARVVLEMFGLYNVLIATAIVFVAIATFKKMFGGD